MVGVRGDHRAGTALGAGAAGAGASGRLQPPLSQPATARRARTVRNTTHSFIPIYNLAITGQFPFASASLFLR